jgi:hypothetical protein
MRKPQESRLTTISKRTEPPTKNTIYAIMANRK